MLSNYQVLPKTKNNNTGWKRQAITFTAAENNAVRDKEQINIE